MDIRVLVYVRETEGRRGKEGEIKKREKRREEKRREEKRREEKRREEKRRRTEEEKEMKKEGMEISFFLILKCSCIHLS
jgi:hypothetical protein